MRGSLYKKVAMSIAGNLACLFFSLSCLAENTSELIKYFESLSIPVEEIKIEAKTVEVRINYGMDDEIDEEKTEKDMLVVSKKLAKEFPNSETIRLHYFMADEEIYTLDFLTTDVKRALKNQKTDEDILGAMEIIMPGGGEEEGVGEVEGGMAPILGVSLAQPQENEIRIIAVIPDSPAEHAGLRIGDRILQVEDLGFTDMGNDAQKLVEHLQRMPSDRPIRFSIERDQKRFDVWVKLQMMNKDELGKILQAQTDRMNSDLVKGRQLLGQNKFEEAVASFQKSLDTHPMESYQGLGICYYHMEKFNEARKNIEKAYKLDQRVPLNVFYTAACRDVLGKSNTAVYHYKEYLALNHDNAEMNAFATERIKALKSRNRKKISQSFAKLVDAIIKEINK